MLDLACGTGDLCRELASSGLRPIGVDLSFGMLAAARTDAPLVHGDALRLPVPDGSVDGVTCGFALRNFVEPRRRSSPSWPGWCGPAGASRCSRWPSRRTGCCGAGHGVYFGKVVPLIGGLLSDPAAYRYLPRSVAYLPAPDAMLDAARAAPGSTDVDRRLLSAGIAQLITGTRSAAA